MVVDELSMVDALLFESLLRALKTGARLILVGMPTSSAVRAGCVLHDLMESGVLPVVQLTEVFRRRWKAISFPTPIGLSPGSAGNGVQDGDFSFFLRTALRA